VQQVAAATGKAQFLSVPISDEFYPLIGKGDTTRVVAWGPKIDIALKVIPVELLESAGRVSAKVRFSTINASNDALYVDEFGSVYHTIRANSVDPLQNIRDHVIETFDEAIRRQGWKLLPVHLQAEVAERTLDVIKERMQTSYLLSSGGETVYRRVLQPAISFRNTNGMFSYGHDLGEERLVSGLPCDPRQYSWVDNALALNVWEIEAAKELYSRLPQTEGGLINDPWDHVSPDKRARIARAYAGSRSLLTGFTKGLVRDLGLQHPNSLGMPVTTMMNAADQLEANGKSRRAFLDAVMVFRKEVEPRVAADFTPLAKERGWTWKISPFEILEIRARAVAALEEAVYA
jgi:hypothetical protein